MYTLNPTTTQKRLLFLIGFFLSTQLFAQPVIQSFAPVSGPVGTPVTITGNGFSAVPANNIVFFGAVKATVTAAGGNSLTVTVPAGATFMPISVAVNRLTAYSARPFIITFPDGSLAGGTAFPFPDKLTTSLYPYAVVITDLNDDGKPDIAAVTNANVPASTLSVFSNTGTGGNLSFSAKKDFPIADMPYGIAAGDLDGDGKPDLAATYISTGGNVSVYKNTSAGGVISLAAPITYTTGSSPYKVLISDIDLDGKPDLVTSNYISGSISVLRNTTTGGTISFAPKVDIVTGPLPYSISIADFDGDGKPDIVTSAQLNNIISIHRNTSNNGTVSFAAKNDITVNDASSGVTTGDVDGDGKPDIAVSYNSAFSILRNVSGTGSISFSQGVAYPVSGALNGPWDITMGDLDGDARPDIAISNPTGTVSVSKNTSASGTISLAPEVQYYSPGAFRVAIGDLNGDAKPEMVVPDFIGTSVMIYRNQTNEPAIFSFSPTEGTEGDTIILKGNILSSVTAVSFGGTPAASFTVVNAGTIRAVLGKGASGQVVVTNPHGTSKSDGFIYHSAPVITAFTPTAGKTGDTIAIKGTYLTGATAVSFGGTPAASFTVDSPTNITAVIADGSSGIVSVTTPYGTSSLPGFTYYPPPVITSFTPTEGDQGTVVTITGTGLSGASSVLVGGVPVASFTVQSATTITAVISEGGTGSIVVIVPGGTDTSSAIFSFPPPVITSFAPLVGPAGSTVTITGANFRSDADANQVFFGAVKATVTAASRTSLKVTVPTGATYAPLTVTVNNHTAFANKPFNTTFVGGDTAFTATSFIWKEGPEAINDWYHDGGRTIFLADMDGDGKSDLISRSVDAKLVTVTRNGSTDGIVSFFYQKFIGDVNNPVRAVRMAIGDVNGDGRPDIVINDNNSNIQVYRNTSTPGNMSFAPKLTVAQGNDLNDILISDFDGDAKADIIAVGSDAQNATLIAYRNTGDNGVLSFTRGTGAMLTAPANHLRTADFDNDGKTDISFTAGNAINVLKNTSTKGSISFTNSTAIPLSNNVAGMALADFDNDNKMDMLASYSNAQSFIVYRNTTASGNISFVPALTYNIGHGQGYIAAGQLDGDGLPDIMVKIDSIHNNGTTRRLLLFRNTGAPGTISFALPGYYDVTHYITNDIGDGEIGDIDGDGKADIALTNTTASRISIFRNQQNEKTVTVCSTTNTTLTTDITSTKYQWQVNSGSGFTTISDNSNYAGATTSTLKLSNIPASWNGYHYRCVGNGNMGISFNLIVHPTVIQSGTIQSASETCADLQLVIFYIPTITSYLSKIELWESVNGGAFTPIQSTRYNGDPYMTFYLPVDSVIGNKRHFFTITPPADVPCTGAAYSDTSITIIRRQPEPIVAIDKYTLTVTNPEAAIQHTWNYKSANGEWEEVGTGIVYEATKTGSYFVRGEIGYGNCSSNRISKEYFMHILEIPVVVAEGFTLTVTNPDTAATYIWEMKNASGNWEAVTPAATDIIYRALKKGTYRVKASMKTHDWDIKYSEEHTVLITSIDPVTAESAGIKLYPNPVSVSLTIGPLKLSNRWQTLDIYSADGKLVLEGHNISNQTTVTLNTAHLVSGAYTVLLRRKQGPPVSIKFVKH